MAPEFCTSQYRASVTYEDRSSACGSLITNCLSTLHPPASVITTLYTPFSRLFKVAPWGPCAHLMLYGVVPPVTVSEIDPSFLPKQVILLEVSLVICNGAVGCVKVMELVLFWHPVWSVRVRTYCPALSVEKEKSSRSTGPEVRDIAVPK